MTKDTSKPPPGSGLIGLALFALVGIGLASALLAIMAIVDKPDYVGCGVLLTASAFSFGLLLNALLRK